MHYEKVAAADELKNGEKKKVILGDNVFLLTKIDGAYYALNNKCPHMGGSLFDGTLTGTTIICPRHGTAFDVRTGAIVRGGRLVFVSIKGVNARAYPVKVEGNDVLVGLE